MNKEKIADIRPKLEQMNKAQFNHFLRENLYYLMHGADGSPYSGLGTSDFRNAEFRILASVDVSKESFENDGLASHVEGIMVLSSKERSKLQKIPRWQLIAKLGIGTGEPAKLIGFYGNRKAFIEWLLLAKLQGPDPSEKVSGRDPLSYIKMPE